MLPRQPFRRAPSTLRNISRRTRERVRLLFLDEARIGHTGRRAHVWWMRGERPPGLPVKRLIFADAACRTCNRLAAGTGRLTGLGSYPCMLRAEHSAWRHQISLSSRRLFTDDTTASDGERKVKSNISRALRLSHLRRTSRSGSTALAPGST